MKSRVAYRSGTMTAKTLAEHLLKRCTKEISALRALPGKEEKYSFSKVVSNGDDTYSFQVTKSVYLTADEMRRLNELEFPGKPYWNKSKAGWVNEWTADVRVTPALDVDISDVFGRANLVALERAALACALGGPDR